MELSQLHITAVMRSHSHSPNLTTADERILQLVVDELIGRGAEIETISEEQFVEQPVETDVVVNMCRTQQALNKLEQLEKGGALVVNSAASIKNCSRRNLKKIFDNNNIPIPKAKIISTTANDDELKSLPYPCWLKLLDSPTQIKEDICHVKNSYECKVALNQYRGRDISDVLVEEHLHGDLVKFYSVANTNFICTTYPMLEGHSKFGYEQHNDTIRTIPFSQTDLKVICEKMAGVTGVCVCGGDCIITPGGEPYIIDFNDWPSFSSCADEAVPAIADMIIKKIEAL